MKDKVGSRFEMLQGDRAARVRVSLGETIGGPSYSSVRVNVDISFQCNQDEDTINEVRDILMGEVAETLDKYIDSAYELMLSHVQRLHRDIP